MKHLYLPSRKFWSWIRHDPTEQKSTDVFCCSESLAVECPWCMFLDSRFLELPQDPTVTNTSPVPCFGAPCWFADSATIGTPWLSRSLARLQAQPIARKTWRRLRNRRLKCWFWIKQHVQDRMLCCCGLAFECLVLSSFVIVPSSCAVWPELLEMLLASSSNACWMRQHWYRYTLQGIKISPWWG